MYPLLTSTISSAGVNINFWSCGADHPWRNGQPGRPVPLLAISIGYAIDKGSSEKRRKWSTIGCTSPATDSHRGSNIGLNNDVKDVNNLYIP